MLLKNPLNKSYGPASADGTTSSTTTESSTKDKKMQWLDYEFKRLLQKYIKAILAEQDGVRENG